MLLINLIIQSNINKKINKKLNIIFDNVIDISKKQNSKID